MYEHLCLPTKFCYIERYSFLSVSSFIVSYSVTTSSSISSLHTAPLNVRLQLKWFNSSKGFGFLVPADESAEPFDAFLHITALQDAGLNMLGEGAILDCEIVDGPKGKQVSRVLEVLEHGDINQIAPPQNEDGTVTMGGLVKWYKPEKGFGFIIADDGQKDVFVHKTILAASGVDDLVEGMRVKITVKTADKGREATEVTVIR